MKKLLIVRAHPYGSDRSRSMQLADAFLAGFRETHPDALVEDINLYTAAVPEIDIDLLSGWEQLREGEEFIHLAPLQQAKLTLFDNYTMQFQSSDTVVIANPLWNLSVPTRLKAWVDTVCRSGVTFRYNSEGRAEGLAGGKQIIHLQASGGHFGGNDPASKWLRTVFTFIGCEFQQYAAEGMDHEPERADEIMRDALEAVRQLGRDCLSRPAGRPS